MRLNKYLFPLLIAMLFINALWGHDIHISRCKAKVSGHKFSGKLTFFKDDFMTALEKWHGKSLVGFSNEAFDQLKIDYLKANFSAIANKNITLKLVLTGHKEDKKSIWFRFKFECETEIKSLKIIQTTLFEPFPQQVNMMHVHAENREYHYAFSTTSQAWQVQF